MFTVYLSDHDIGTIEKAGNGIRFAYGQAALDSAEVPALSLSLPKQPKPYPNRRAGAFFRNLLPEQSYGRLVAGATDADLSDSLGLLGAIGGECPGAVSIWPPSETPPSHHDYSELTVEGMKSLFGSGGPDGLGSAVVRGRLSLPGVQEKIALLRSADGTWMLPLRGAVTSHILKQPSGDFPGLLANELFCMSLADAGGLDVPSVGIVAREVEVLTVQRFDRMPTSGNDPAVPMLKLHQEDFCQALSVQPERKYQHDGGPGLSSCIRLIRERSSLPADDIPRLVRWVGFNYLIGNEDAHAKNLAFLYTADGLRLTPHYDLVCTVVYENLKRSLAMKIGGSWHIRNIQRSDWKRFARQTRLSWDAVRAILLALSDDIERTIDSVLERCREEVGSVPELEGIRAVVERHVEQMRRELV